jgi:Protein of unknown function (DUF998)
MKATHRYACHFVTLSTIAFIVTCLVAHVLRADLSPFGAPLSAYLSGSTGTSVRFAYYAMSVCLVTLGWLSYFETKPQARSVLPTILFVIAGAALTPVALTASDQANAPVIESLHRLVHSVALQATFVCLAVGPLYQSLMWRRDPRLLGGIRVGGLLGLTILIVYCVVRADVVSPRGAIQKLFVALILIWILWAARQIHRMIVTQLLRQSASSTTTAVSKQ